ncbi:MAG TPA: outer membrane protein assembly factor BamA [Acidobacteriota bacterium]
MTWRGPSTEWEARLVGNVGLVEGAELEPALVRRAIRVLILTGRYQQVRIEAERRGAATDLVVELVPRERIVAVEFSGDLELSDQRAREAIDIRPPEPYDPLRASSNAEAIRRRWRELGYWMATVEPRAQTDPLTREVRLDFRIQAGPPTRLAKVELLGAVPGLPEAELQRQLKSAREGERLQRPELERDLERLERHARERGYFDFQAAAPEIVQQPGRNAVELTLRFEVGPRYELLLEGVSLEAEELRERLPFWEEERVDPGSLEDAEASLVDWMQARGYALAQAHAELESVSPQLKRIRIRVEPGPEVRLRSLQMRGNHHFSAEELRAELARLGSPLVEGGPLDPNALSTDREVVRRHYVAAGFIDAAVTPEVVYGAELTRANVIYRIEEGPQFVVEAVELSGNRALSEAELRGALQLQSGRPFDPDAVLRDSNAIHSLYAEAGFLDASIQPVRTLDRERARARVEFHINEGRQILIEALVVRGNQTTSEAVVRREVTLRAGDPMRASALLSSQRNLYRLDVFRSVMLRPLDPGSLLARQPLLIDLEELPRFSMTYGFGYDTESGPRGTFGVTDTNAFGRAQRLGVQLQASQRTQRAQLSLRDPKPWGRPLDTTAILFGELEQFGRGAESVDVEIQRFGAALQVLREHDRRRTSLFEYKFQEVKNFFEAGANIEDIPPEDRAGAIASLSYRLVRDTRPDPFEPTRGSFLTANLELASSALGGSADFVKFFGQASKLLPVGRGWVVAAGARVGVAYGYRGEEELPFSERFFAGGANSLRGFDRDRAGPVAQSPDPEDPNRLRLIPLGGNALVVSNLELRVPLWGSVAGAVFTDVGNVFETVGLMRFTDLRVSLGVGLRYRTAVGPFRIDLGYNPDPRFDYEDSTIIHVSFGHAF